MSLIPLIPHRLSWAERKALHERLGMLHASVGSAERKDIEEAMTRIGTPTYGSCIRCSAPIAWDRLVARPQLRRCSRCEALEK